MFLSFLEKKRILPQAFFHLNAVRTRDAFVLSTPPTPTPTPVISKRTQCYNFYDNACLMWSPHLIIARGLRVSGHVVRASDTSPKGIGHEGVRRHSTRTWTRPFCSAAQRPLCYFHRQTLRELLQRRMGLGNDYATFPCARTYLPSKQGWK